MLRAVTGPNGSGHHPFLEAFEDLTGCVPFRKRDDVGSQWPYLARLLLPNVAGLPFPPKAEAADERDRLLPGIAGCITTAAANCPIAIVIDDLHWADEASLDLVQHLARNTEAVGSHPCHVSRCRCPAIPRLSKALRDLYESSWSTSCPFGACRGRRPSAADPPHHAQIETSSQNSRT